MNILACVFDSNGLTVVLLRLTLPKTLVILSMFRVANDENLLAISETIWYMLCVSNVVVDKLRGQKPNQKLRLVRR